MRLSYSLAALALFAAACDSGSGPAAAPPEDVPEAERYGGTAVVISPQEIGSLYPGAVRDKLTRDILSHLLLVPVITVDAQFDPAPGLATSWETDPDTTELTFHLRRDLYWHDGVKTTAWDLQFGYDLLRQSGAIDDSFEYGEAAVPDSFTFKVKMRPHPEHLYLWEYVFAMPRHLLRGVAPEQMERHPQWGDRLIGNGPFRLAFRDGERWTFDANPRFPSELGGRPYLERVVLRVVPEPSVGMTELLSGSADYLLDVPPAQSRRVRQVESVRLHSYPNRAFTFVAWNGRRPLFEDSRTRRALTKAINRRGIIDGLGFGYGQVANSSVPPFHWAHDATVGADLGHDPEGARALLREAGWEDRNGDGILENGRGEPFRFLLATIPGNSSILQAIQADLLKVGIDLRPQVQEFHSVVRRLEGRDFDAVLLNLFPSFRIDDRPLFHCDYLETPFQTSGYCNPEVDRLIDSTQAITDRARARPYWIRYQQELARDQPFTFLYFEEALTAVGRRLHDVRPDARSAWNGVSRWWIDPAQRARPAGPPAATEP